MGDWADYIETGRNYPGPPRPRKVKRHKERKVTISVQVSKEDREKYMRIGGAKWFKGMLIATCDQEPLDRI